MNKVDVCVNVYGKPWQTLCTLNSLLKHSGESIDKIYIIQEVQQPYAEDIEWLYTHFNNLVIYVPALYTFAKSSVDSRDIRDRYNLRYQYGIEKSNKKHLFITHNDVLYTGDIITDMLQKIGDSVGIGEIGQCWNCPAASQNLCHGSTFYDWNPTVEEVLRLPLPHVRTNLHNVDKANPKPLPECRLNEWACLVNLELSNKETFPNGNTPFFGTYGLDLGDPWFKSLHLKGYQFVDYRQNFIHSYWSPTGNGYQTQLNQDLYVQSETTAKKYFEQHYAN